MLNEKIILKATYEKQIFQSQVETQEETFSAIGKELHDNIGQLLNSTKLLIGVTQRTLKEYPDTLQIADETLGTAIYELRALSKSMNKEWLQQFNFVQNLDTEVKRINSADSLRLHFLPAENVPFKSDEQIILFRIVQEALQNAIKHANAKNIYINLLEGADLFSISIIDDGQGSNGSTPFQAGMGMVNMQHRIKLLGGNIQWQPDNEGTSVIIQLPIEPIQS